MRELRVEDALLYLDQVKVEFGDRPHIYNEFLDIMKTFKTQQLDTPGVIRRVSTLFQGNKNLVLGFNTFLPEGYKIELPDGGGPPVAVYRAPGQSGVTQILGPGLSSSGVGVAQEAAASTNGPSPPPASQQQQPSMAPLMQSGIQQPPSPQAMPPQSAGGVVPMELSTSNPPQQAALPVQQAPPRAPQQPGNGHGDDIPLQLGMAQHQAGLEAQGPVAMQAGGAVPKAGYGPPAPPHIPPHETSREPPVEFDHAINYVTTIKKRFATEPETYKKFLEILHTYQKEQRGIKEVLDEVSLLFADHPDLLKQFTYFLPDAVQAQAKAQLDQVAKESEARKRAASSKQAIMQTAQGMQRQAMRGQPIGAGGVVPARTYASQVTVPFGASQGRSDEREREICRSAIYGSISFNPMRPPRRSEPAIAMAALKNGRPTIIPETPIQPTTAEAAFFERAKLHLNRRELAPDKPPGSRRHTPYTEFLKCLHLFGAEILNKEELLLLLRGLFMQGHAPKSGINAGGGASNPAVASDATELMREFEEILVGRGPYAEQEEVRRDKSKYGALSLREHDFSHCDEPTPSYHSYPSDFPKALFYSHSGRTDMDSSVLNDDIVCVAANIEKKRQALWAPEGYSALRARLNANEEAMFKVEDERYEVDMAIERNVVAMRQVEPMAEEVTHLRENEEKDGQPIGRMQYSLRSRTLNCTQISAIARVYGDRGDEVLQHLLKTPVAVLPIVYQRLRQKDAEWRKAKSDMFHRWGAICEANYEGSLDVLCSSYKKELEKIFSVDRLIEDCKRTAHFVRHPRRNDDHPATVPYRTILALSSTDTKQILYQPFLSFKVTGDMLHKDAFHLVSSTVAKRFIESQADHERASRIWSEWLAEWFGFPAHWILEELRKSESIDGNTVAVTYAPGQNVRTAFGDGVVVSRIAPSATTGLRYKVRLPYGIGYIRPSSVFNHLPTDKQAHQRVRRNGVMEVVDLLDDGRLNEEVEEHNQMMFSTEDGYVFMRLYCMLAAVLTNTQEYLDGHKDELIEERKNESLSLGAGVSSTSKPVTDPPRSYDYLGFLDALQTFLAGDMDASTFENFCRKLTKRRVYQLVALPKLVEQCAEALVSVSKDECMLRLYDVSKLKVLAPERLRALSCSETSNACFRLQYDAREGRLYCSYIAPGESVMLERQEPPADTPSERADDDSDDVDMTMDDDDEEEEEEEEDGPGAENGVTANMVATEENGGIEVSSATAETTEDADTEEPKAKRPKL